MDADLHVETETIGGKPPVGICGTGVIESTCELLRTERIDETGRLDEEYFKEGFPLTEEMCIRDSDKTGWYSESGRNHGMLSSRAFRWYASAYHDCNGSGM